MINDFNKKVINYGKRKDLCFNAIEIIRDDKTEFEVRLKAHKIKLGHKKKRKLIKFNLNKLLKLLIKLFIVLMYFLF